MDAVFLNFHKEEDFSSYFSSYEEDSQSYDGMQNQNTSSNYHWLDYERELNGDMGLIPIQSETNFVLSTSPPTKEDFNKIMNDWNHLVSLEVGDDLVNDLESTAEHVTALPAPVEDLLDIKEEDFDITKYVVGSEPDIPEKLPEEVVEDVYSLSSSKPIATSTVTHNVKDDKEDSMDLENEVVGRIETNRNLLPADVIIGATEVKTPKKKSKQFLLPPQKFGGKRIDMARGRYMVDSSEDSDEDEDIDVVDVETVEGEVSHPVLQAGDLDSLLEQFEATENTNMELNHHIPSTPERGNTTKNENDIMLEIFVEQVKLVSPIKSPMVTTNLRSAKGNRKSLDFREAKPKGNTATTPNITKIKTEKTDINPEFIEIKKEPEPSEEYKETRMIKTEPTSPVKDQRKNKQILDALPTELINRIRASSKRKPVPVIEPIMPVKRRMINNNNACNNNLAKDPISNSVLANRIINCNNQLQGLQTSAANGTTTKLHTINNNKLVSNESTIEVIISEDTKNVMLDHDYCTYQLPNTHYVGKETTNSAKDSGFSSAEEDDKSIIRTQPTIKSSNGKLMVSLLKTNTIKKKLNLEEYKKRLQSRPCLGSGNNSPAGTDDDENTRRLKHTEMLMKMAQDHLKQGNKSPSVADVTLPIIEMPPKGDVKSEVKKTVSTSTGMYNCHSITTQIKQEPDDGDVKVEIIEHKKPRPPKNIVMKTLVSVGTNTEESWGHLEQILQNTHIKISPNSLISSIVEQLPKPKRVDAHAQIEHGEDKTIVFIDTTAPRKKVHSTLVQTLHSSSHLLRKRRRRTSSSSSGSSDSTDSDSDSDSARGRSRSHSRSRTPSPVRRKTKQQIKEVEERRVVYVGKLDDNITKEDLRRRFARFGAISNISIHLRSRQVNYGFVTYLHKEDAYEAVERGNDNPDEPEYDLSFGGRRLFCQTTYADLDNMRDDDDLYDEYGPWVNQSLPSENSSEDDFSFDNLLRKAQAKLRNRKL